VERRNAALTLDQSNNRLMAGQLLCVGPVLRSTSDIGFIGFNEFVLTTYAAGQFALSHRLANAMSQKPRGLQATAKRPMQLSSRDALLAGAEQVNCLKPEMQGDMRGLKKSSRPHRERLAARAAFPEAGPSALAFQQRCFTNRTAMRANRAVRPKPRLYVCNGGFLVAELRAFSADSMAATSPLPPVYLLGMVCQV
jgi:hypothetical protein